MYLIFSESLLHLIWKHQIFSKTDLETVNGEKLIVFAQGILNHNQGPDFSGARIKLGDIIWSGDVEIHIKSSDWKKHKHFEDPNYNKVVLHVVWEFDSDVIRSDKTKVPTLELKNLVPPEVIEKYKGLLNRQSKIKCEEILPSISKLSVLSMLDRSLRERFNRKSREVLNRLSALNGDWEVLAYEIIASAFGSKVNKEAFHLLSQNLPIKIIRKHANNSEEIEALVFGTAGFLKGDFQDDYYKSLKNHYTFFSEKYSLSEGLETALWKSHRMRPQNAPHIRLAQFADYLNNTPNFFHLIRDFDSPDMFKKSLKVEGSQYWKSHIKFGSEFKHNARLGSQMLAHICINAYSVLLYAYSQYTKLEIYEERAFNLLENIKSEKNAIVNHWSRIGLQSKTAADSQSLIELFNNYCSKSLCSSCNIGYKIINH